jgi:ABC-type amino acid transport substrate-binding protein
VAFVATGCNIEPPQTVRPERFVVTEAYERVPGLIDSPTVIDAIYKGYFRVGLPLASPYSMVRPGPGDLVGVFPDMANELAERLGFRGIIGQVQRWEDIPDDLDKGVVQLIFVTEEPANKSYGWVPVLEVGYCLIRGSNPSSSGEDRLAVVAGAPVGREFLPAAGEVVEVTEPTLEGAIRAVVEGVADRTVIVSSLVPLIPSDHRGLTVEPSGCGDDSPLWTLTWGITTRGDDPAIVEFLKQFVTQLASDGVLADSISEWAESTVAAQRVSSLIGSP